MAGTRSIARQAPPIVIALVALSISLAGGAYATTSHTSARVQPAAITWSTLTLHNGWKSANTSEKSGDPRVGIQNGIVYLSGGPEQSSGTTQQFATLPSAYRPTHNLWITVYTYEGTSGTLIISPDGTMDAYSSTGSICGGGRSNAECFTSLAGVSFPKTS